MIGINQVLRKIVMPVVVLAVVVSLGFSSNVLAALQAKTSLGVTLKQLHTQKKRVDLVLNNGQKYAGVIADVSDHFLVLKLAGTRSFYDAKIRIDHISSIEVRMRNK